MPGLKYRRRISLCVNDDKNHFFFVIDGIINNFSCKKAFDHHHQNETVMQFGRSGTIHKKYFPEKLLSRNDGKIDQATDCL